MYGTKEEVIAHLNRHWADDEPMAVSIWISEDVTYCHEEWVGDSPAPVDPAHYKEILEYFADNEDASIGLNWDSLRHAIEAVMEDFDDETEGTPVTPRRTADAVLTGDPDIDELLIEDGSIEDFKDVE